MKLAHRLKSAGHAALWHLFGVVFVMVATSLFVFGLWFPYPYAELASGYRLVSMIAGIEVVCGPLLTAVLFSRSKPQVELWRDLGLVALIQVAALAYGLFTIWHARPLFLAQETDRFKVVILADIAPDALDALPAVLKPGWLSGPIVVALREPIDSKERNKVLLESVQGGRDYAERPEFYLPYEGAAAMKSLQRAKPLVGFLQKKPDQQDAARKLALKKGADIAQWLYLPVIAREDWVAVLDKQGQIQGFLEGDGF